MKLIKRIIYSLLGLLMVLTVGMVALILYAEYSGKPFSLRAGASQEESLYQEEASRLVQEEAAAQEEATDAVTGDAPAPETAAEPAADAAADAAAPVEAAAPDAAPAEPAVSAAPAPVAPASDTAVSYVLNKESAIFHNADCPLAAEISADNYGTMTGTRDDVTGRGYDPCTSCNP